MIRALLAGVFGLLLIAAAVAFDTLSLYVPGVALVALGAGSALWVGLASAGARVERTLGGAVVEEEQPYPVRIEARTGPLPAPGGELVEPLGGTTLPLAGRRGRRVSIDVRFARRGRRELAPSSIVIRDPLGLAVRERRSAGGEVLVLPRVEPVQLAAGGGAGGVTDAGQLISAAAETELDSLRPYRPGAPASRIHWPTVARSGEMVERRMVADEDLRPLVVLDARRPATEEALDSAVRAAASLAVHLASAGGCAVLLPGDRRATALPADLRPWPALHARLALVEAGDSAPALARLGRGGAILWVTAAAGAEPPPGLRRAAAAARYLVTPSPVGTTRASFTVAGCGGYRLGRASRRVAA